MILRPPQTPLEALSDFVSSQWIRYGEHWGEGAARCFSLEADILDEARNPVDPGPGLVLDRKR